MTAFLTVFLSVFIAELGDKTQLATALFAADGARSKWLVFFASSAALVTSAAVATLAGSAARELLPASWHHRGVRLSENSSIYASVRINRAPETLFSELAGSGEPTEADLGPGLRF